jgi:excisionase family DNA binding protein
LHLWFSDYLLYNVGVKYDKEMLEYLTLMEVSQFLKVHPNTLRNWDNNGELKSVRIGVRKLRRYRREDIEKFIEKSNGETMESNQDGCTEYGG